MTLDETIEFVRAIIKEAFEQDCVDVSVDAGTALIGGDSTLDSMRLVELCLELEDKAAEIGFEFDWTSDAAMSKSRSMFRSVQSLAEEFVNQQGAQK